MRPLLLLPTYNEAATLAAVVDAVRKRAEVDLLVIDDASPDGTGAIAEGLGVRTIHRPAKKGLGSAYREGMAQALAEGRPAVLEMDADFSHDPQDIPRLLAALEAGADLALGTRTLPGGGMPGWPLWRQAVSRGGNLYARALLGIPASDLTSGFRAYRGEALRRADPTRTRSEGYVFQIEMAWRVWREGGRIDEVPIVFADRRTGASKMDGRIVREAALGVPALALERIVGRRERR